ncbi:hypothetical protein MKW94_018370 [Papaver nudicaule]|uniref:Beta-glucosidase n=1 Tax=Papaver nudicaule TaxID=74823 RepID=A0AA41VMZ5_PAPNU|nr:hypothetical protein [Papaver nudicaule]
MDQGKIFSYPFVLFFLATVLITGANAHNVSTEVPFRDDFPKDFIFGVASAAFQNEGATREGGRGMTIWDTFVNTSIGMIHDHSNAEVAVDSYHRYKDDVKLIKEMGMDSYRFSIAWSRILPGGKLSKGVNKEGVAYYNNLINELLAHGIQPFVTLLHFDLPQALEDEYGGLLSEQIANDFKDYVEVCFKEFGDRVKHWITINEPLIFVLMGYDLGIMPPGRCSDRHHCKFGNSGIEPYIAGHNLLLAHSAAANLYKDKYQASQKGVIGITLFTDWMLPASTKEEDALATKRALDFSLGWFLEPLVYGHYPAIMIEMVQDRLPMFSYDEYLKLKGSFDFIGLNYYSSNCISNDPPTNATKISYSSDSQTKRGNERNGVVIGPKAALDWLNVYPSGIKDVLLYVKETYNNPPIYITENGYPSNTTESFEEAITDATRVNYYIQHLYHLQQAIKQGADVRGYIAWTLMDNFEFTSGYTVAFGLYHVDRKDGLKRYPKDSSRWFKNFLHPTK